MIKLSFPFTEEKIRALKVGDEVLISGVVFTGRGASGVALAGAGRLSQSGAMPEAERLAVTFLQGVLPAKAARDAAHQDGGRSSLRLGKRLLISFLVRRMKWRGQSLRDFANNDSGHFMPHDRRASHHTMSDALC